MVGQKIIVLGVDATVLPCPFCGRPESRIVFNGLVYHVFCRVCGAKGLGHQKWESAVKIWNLTSKQIDIEKATKNF